MKFTYVFLMGMVVLVAGCGKKAFDQTKPENVVERLFEAAKANDPSMLAGLCDPKGEGDGDTEDLCAMSAESSGSDAFMEYKEFFQDGTLDGGAEIAGDEARVDFHFGPGGRRGETMELIRRGDKWYLNSF